MTGVSYGYFMMKCFFDQFDHLCRTITGLSFWEFLNVFQLQELTEARAARCSSTHLGELARLMRGDSKLGKLEDSMEVVEVGLGVLIGK